jgi:RNA polymerase sigma-70 factor (ECF subfamily)
MAADAVQDAFIQAYVHWSRISAYDQPVTWVRRVAINRLRNQLRHTWRGQAAVTYLSRESLGHATSPDPDLTKGIASLPVQQRTALVLHYFNGLSLQDVARSMGVSEGTVKRYLFRARQTLRPALEVSDA